jgi:hypothetical protein
MPRSPDRPQKHDPPIRGVPPEGLADPRREGGVHAERKTFKDKAALAADRTPSPSPEKPQREGGMIDEGSVAGGGSARPREGGMIGDA